MPHLRDPQSKPILVSPMIAALMRAIGINASDFLAEFDKAIERDGVWLSQRSSLPDMQKFIVRASGSHGLIVADATIDKRIHLDERRPVGFLRAPIELPAIIDASLIGKTMRHVVEHPLTNRSDMIIKTITSGRFRNDQIFTYASQPEKLEI
jgi:hypothetical protein